MSCTNNLKQTGLAMHLYHDAFGRLPAAWMATHPTSGQPYWLGRPGWAWGAAILPYLEQEAIVKSLVHFDRPITDALNQAARVAVVKTYRCPSDTGRDTFVLDPGTMPMPNYMANFTSTELATSNYVGVFGTVSMMRSTARWAAPADGSMVFQQGFRFADITDGLSETLLVGERNSTTRQSTWVGVLAGGAHSPACVVGVATNPPNAAQGAQHTFSSFHAGGTNFRPPTVPCISLPTPSRWPLITPCARGRPATSPQALGELRTRNFPSGQVSHPPRHRKRRKAAFDTRRRRP